MISTTSCFSTPLTSRHRRKVKIELSAGTSGIAPGPIAIYRKSLKSRGTQVVAGDGASTVFYWNYPTGGDDIAQIAKNLDDPFGVAISLGD